MVGAVDAAARYPRQSAAGDRRAANQRGLESSTASQATPVIRVHQGMIRKSGYRFFDKIMLKQRD
jgi:hypothetical protein